MVFSAEEKIILHMLVRKKPPDGEKWYSTLLTRESKIDPRKISSALKSFSTEKPVSLIKLKASKNKKGYPIELIEVTDAGLTQEEFWWDYLEPKERKNFIAFYLDSL